MTNTPRSDAVFGPEVFGDRARTCRELETELTDTQMLLKMQDASVEMLLYDIEKATNEREKLRDDWQKLRLALNQIAHPTSYGTVGSDPVEIAREALRIGGKS